MSDRRITRSRWLTALAMSAGVFLALIGLRLAGALEPLELAAYDLYLRARPIAEKPESPIVLVRIYEEDIRRFGYPICDQILIRVVTTLLEAEPRAVGIDLYRDMPVPRACDGFDGSLPPPPDYFELGETVSGNDRVFVVTKLPDGRRAGTPPPQWLEGTDQVGFSDFPVDPGGIIRRALLFLWEGETPHLSLSLRLALRYLRDDGVSLEADPHDPDWVRLGGTTIPALEPRHGGYARTRLGDYQVLLDYRRGTNSFPSISLGELLSKPGVRPALRDKIVILGTTAPSVKDLFYTPAGSALRNGQSVFGLELHAHAIDQLLRFASGEDRPIASMGEATETLWILVWSLLGGALGLWARNPWPGALAGVAGLGLIVFGGYAALLEGWWIPIVPPVLAGVSSAGLVTAYVAVVERRERAQVTQLFSRFLRPAVAEQIWQQRDEFMGGPGRPRSRWVTITVLVADLQGFTSTAEKVDPYVLMGWVNQFLAEMAAQVEAHGGVVDDYAGDGLKADFGFPIAGRSEEEIRSQAVNAVRCALAMGESMERLNEGWRERRLPPGRMRIGIFTGSAVAGVIGSEQSLKYTTVGDTVNTAARLESFDKGAFRSDSDESAWRILVGAETLRHIGGRFRVVDLGVQQLPGKEEGVRIHRVLGVSDPG